MLLRSILPIGLLTGLSAFGQLSGVSASLRSPQPTGTLITWRAQGAAPNTWFRFRAGVSGGALRTIRDFGPGTEVNWTATDWDGNYVVEITARNNDTGATATSTIPFQFTSPAASGAVSTSPTEHPLVVAFHAPACPAGSQIRVQFQGANGRRTSTPLRDCRANQNPTFLLGGMLPDATYVARHQVFHRDGTTVEGRDISFQTGSLPRDLTIAKGTVAVPQQIPALEGILLLASSSPTHHSAVDLEGNVIWYYPGALSGFTRLGRGGTFWGLTQGPGGTPAQAIREFDLTGMTLRETNASRLNEQLRARGQMEISNFHHEVRPLPDGRILVLAGVEQILTDVQGPGAQNVLGDMILILDADLQLVWVWNSFEKMDVRRMATLRLTCAAGGCGPLYKGADAQDWLHTNAVQRTQDGNLILSVRHQDWVVKIDYRDGAGTGDVLWRMGPEGDFAVVSSDPQPWFTHLHDPEFEADGRTMVVFDNGNTRQAKDATVESRGQVYWVDEPNRVVIQFLNASLGKYAFALGSAQMLSNGGYFFDLGWRNDRPTPSSLQIETDPLGNQTYVLDVPFAIYRSFRLTDLYTPDR